MQLKVLDLFSGLGGFSLGLERTGCFTTVAFCEIDKYCKLILNKHWKGIKIYDDVKKISKEQFDTDGTPYPDVVTGGFPCQPFSVAGKQKGTGDDRHLWPQMFRIIQTFKPKFVIGENVKGLINIQDGVVFETVCTDLENEGYEVQAFNIPAAGVGAPHRRERIWILATNVAYTVSDDEREAITRSYEEARSLQEEHRKNYGSSRFFSGTSAIWSGDRGYEDVANSNTRFIDGTNEEVCTRGQTSNASSTRGRDEDVENSRCTLQQRTFVQGENENEIRKRDADQSERPSGSSRYDVADTKSGLGNDFQTNTGTSESKTQEVFGDGSSIPRESSWWEFEPNVGRVAYGVSGRVHRLKGLGNSIVPQIAEEIGKAIIGVYNGDC